MKLLRRCVEAGLLLSLLAPAWGEMGPRPPRVTADDTGRVIVKYRADSALMRPLAAQTAPRPLHAASLGARLGVTLADRWVLGERMQSLSARGIDAAELARRIAALPDVEFAVPVRRKYPLAALPNDPYLGSGQTTITPAVGQWYLRAPGSTFVSAIDAVGAWNTTRGSALITVAVLDTGVRFDHPDLIGKLYAGYDFISRSSTANDGDVRDDDASDPGDATTESDTCGAGSSSWHGTQTAGIVGAQTDNGVGMAAIGRDVMVLPVRVLGKCGGYDDDIIAGMRWAAGISSSPSVNVHPAKVINMSLGSTGTCDSAYGSAFNEITAAGVSIVVAAGNETGHAVGTPANCPGAVAVGGLRHIGTKVGFSDVGPEITISAPGGNCVNEAGACLYPILTTTNSGASAPAANTYSNSSDFSVGTSFSAPMVAGAIALMLSVDPTLAPATIKAKLQSTARTFPTTGADPGVPQCHAPDGSDQIECYCTTSTCGAGMLDVRAAVLSVVPGAAPPIVNATVSAANPAVGDMVTLSASEVAANGGRTIATYDWTIVSGTAAASIVGSSTGTSISMNTLAAGNVLVLLTVTDSSGAATAKMASFTVGTPSGGGGGDSTGGDSGGGAMSSAWLAGLLTAVLALAWAQRRG
jgi:serine protease